MIYSVFIYLFYGLIRLSALWNPKAKAWISGRKYWEADLSAKFSNPKKNKRIWMHCASLGEFEQGRPVLEALRASYPTAQIVLSFFSPSGYEVRKNYALADHVCYLPLDTRSNAKAFLKIVDPDLIIFVKYEYWPNFLAQIYQQQIPFIQVSSIFRPNYIFFKWYGGSWRRSLKNIHQIFIQDEQSARLLDRIGVTNYSITGDTRYDRVVSIRDQFTPISAIEQFSRGKKILVAGSTWGPDEQLLSKLASSFPELYVIIAPHEINEEHLQKIEESFPNSIRYSHYQASTSEDVRILVIDNIGMLSKLYHYATCCYVGGGFGAGIHNTLEAAAHGKPVIFGPKYQKFTEAIELIEKGAGFSIQDYLSLHQQVQRILVDEAFLQKASVIAAKMVEDNSGATQKIMHYIQENRLLTN